MKETTTNPLVCRGFLPIIKWLNLTKYFYVDSYKITDNFNEMLLLKIQRRLLLAIVCLTSDFQTMYVVY